MNKKLSLRDQARIELKKRSMKKNKSSFSLKTEFVIQLMLLLPAILWKEKQRAFINAKQFIKWYLGGYKSGKTFTGVSYLIWLAYVNRPFAGILVHPTDGGIAATIEPLIEEICELNSIEYEVKVYKTRKKLILKFGMNKNEWGNIWLASGDNPKSLKGPKLAFGMIDEPFVMKSEIVDVVMSRIVDIRAKLWQLIFTGTPEPMHMQWGYDVVEKKEQDDDERFIITVSTREMKEFLRPGYVEDFEKNNTPEMVANFIDGECQNLSGSRVYYAFKRKVNTFDKLDGDDDGSVGGMKDKLREMILGYDFNVNQMSATLWKRYGIYKDQMEEFRIQSTSNTKELTELAINRMIEEGYLKKKEDDCYYTAYGRSLIITGDATGNNRSSKSNKSDYDIIVGVFRDYKVKFHIYVPTSNPAVRDRTNYMNTEFEKGLIRIEKNCTLTIRDRELGIWKKGATGFYIDQSKEELTHLSDSGDYALYNTQALEGSAGGSGGAVKVTRRESRR